MSKKNEQNLDKVKKQRRTKNHQTQKDIKPGIVN